MKRAKRKSFLEREQYKAWCKRVGLDPNKSISKSEFTPLQAPKIYRRDEGENYPSHEFQGKIEYKEKPHYEGEMLERELAAQKEIERKKMRVAPLHKSNYIYIDDGINPAGLGRKNEVL